MRKIPIEKHKFLDVIYGIGLLLKSLILGYELQKDLLLVGSQHSLYFIYAKSLHLLALFASHPRRISSK